jgi:hypothetical protein
LSVEDPALLTLPDPAGVAHVPSPRQNVEDDALVPELRFATGRFPVTSFARRTVSVLLAPLIVLFVSVSAPARVARVPVVGKVTLVPAVTVRVVEKAPDIASAPANERLPASVIDRSASPTFHDTVRFAVSPSDVADFKSNAAPVDRIPNPVIAEIVPPTKFGAETEGDVRVLFVSVSVPASVAKSPSLSAELNCAVVPVTELFPTSNVLFVRV